MVGKQHKKMKQLQMLSDIRKQNMENMKEELDKNKSSWQKKLS